MYDSNVMKKRMKERKKKKEIKMKRKKRHVKLWKEIVEDDNDGDEGKKRNKKWK